MIESPLRSLKFRNLFTYLSAAAALAAVWPSEWPVAAQAGCFLGVSAFFDMLDGAFARLFPSSDFDRNIGGQLDSLVDAIAFGFVPALTLARLGSFDAPTIVASFAFVIAAVSRLAFYNVATSEGRFFIGVPTTVAGGLFWSTSLLIEMTPLSRATTLFVLAVLMVAPLKIPRPRGKGLLPLLLWSLVLAALHAR